MNMYLACDIRINLPRACVDACVPLPCIIYQCILTQSQDALSRSPQSIGKALARLIWHVFGLWVHGWLRRVKLTGRCSVELHRCRAFDLCTCMCREPYELMWCDVIWYGVAWYTVLYDIMRYGMIWYDMILYDVCFELRWYGFVVCLCYYATLRYAMLLHYALHFGIVVHYCVLHCMVQSRMVLRHVLWLVLFIHVHAECCNIVSWYMVCCVVWSFIIVFGNACGGALKQWLRSTGDTLRLCGRHATPLCCTTTRCVM